MNRRHPRLSPNDTQPLIPEGAPPGIPDSDAVLTEMRRLAGKYAFTALSEFGRSLMRRPLLYLCAGKGPRRVFYSASHHANEWISTLVLIKFMNELFEAGQADGRIAGFRARELIGRTTLCFAPLIDPDGVDLVLGALGSGNFFRRAKEIAANYPSIPFTSGWKANIAGIDLNLQYPANWEKARELKQALGYTGPAPRDYVGPAPLSAPESRALAAFTRGFNPDTVLALHTQGQVIYWSFAETEPKGAYALGLKLAGASGYALTQTPPESDNAGYKDWFIQDFKRPGYTVEMGLGESPLPLSQFDGICADMTTLLAVAANG